ncbi:chlorophyll synthesis pathway protein BchC [Penicillium vulpinum]|uniref:Enoyl reductase (ER) domain-containing protein n=1 Tax=Penicillium vulpinum TaxID=29845 RepID=A0A1V6RYV0_9EURO|nr:chlorophyll synthesis pathway protein BchC [Penicillium vulpinum]KAJ5951524.1 chlorophyll synthesis pathway protein BchC [Penicillium vulpinum]OQE06689.1 hypothetical protein PENVUL_c017G04904 [Penicillium vulpinum]
MMRAAKYYGKEDVRVEQVPIPQPGPALALVEIEWCGICGSDLHEFITGPVGIPKPGFPHPLTNETLPIIWGHEFCGTIKSVPPGINLKVGQAVAIDPRLICGTCGPCNNHADHGCHKLGFMGVSGRGGGFSEFVAVEPSMIHPLPKDMPLEYGAILEPLAVANHAVKMAGNLPWDNSTVLILGSGPVGIALILCLKAYGVRRIIVSEPTMKRRQQVEDIADTVINPMTDEVEGTCRVTTEGQGVDVVFDCAGVPQALNQAFRAIKVHGMYVNVAIWEKQFEIPFGDFMWKHITVLPSMAYNAEDFREVVKMVAEGQLVGYENIVTARISLEDIASEGLWELIRNKDQHIKILVTPKSHLLH